MNLLCQGAGGCGQDWDGPHRWVGRLLLGHTVRQDWGWVGSTGHYQDNAGEHVSRFIGSDPTRNSDSQVFEGLSGYVTFQASHDFCGVESFIASSGHIAAGVLVRGHAG